ncbi:hypothetical protein ABES13_01245 [Bacillus pseudomycoides]|nr:hypothetical protein [Bacillus pseudomycoides]
MNDLEVLYSAASPKTKSEDLPFDISWLTDWFVSLFKGTGDYIFVLLSIVILISLLVFGASLWFKHIKWKKRSIYFGVGSILLIWIIPVLVLTTHSFNFQSFMSNMVGLKFFRTTKAILSGIEAMHMIKKRKLFYRTSLFKIRQSLFLKCLDL